MESRTNVVTNWVDIYTVLSSWHRLKELHCKNFRYAKKERCQLHSVGEKRKCEEVIY